MGKIQGGILGVMTGKVGGVVGSTWKDKNTLRSYRATIATSQTADAVNTRGTFAKSVALTSQVAPVIARPMWQRFQRSMSGYNAVQGMVRKCFSLAGVFDYSKFKVSEGVIAKMNSLNCITAMGVVTFQWINQPTGYQLATDIPVFVVISPDGTKAIAKDGADLGVTRADEEAQFSASSIDVQSGYHGYVAFRRADGTMVSETDHDQIA